MSKYHNLNYDRKKLREATQKSIGTSGGAALGTLAGSFMPAKSLAGMATGAAAGAIGGGLLGRHYLKPKISDNALDAGVRKSLIQGNKKAVADLKKNYGLKLKKQAALENYYFIKESNAKALFAGLGRKAGPRNLKVQQMQAMKAPNRQVQQMQAMQAPTRQVQSMDTMMANRQMMSPLPPPAGNPTVPMM